MDEQIDDKWTLHWRQGELLKFTGMGCGGKQKQHNEVLVYQAYLVKICSKNWMSDEFNP